MKNFSEKRKNVLQFSYCLSMCLGENERESFPSSERRGMVGKLNKTNGNFPPKWKWVLNLGVLCWLAGGRWQWLNFWNCICEVKTVLSGNVCHGHTQFMGMTLNIFTQDFSGSRFVINWDFPWEMECISYTGMFRMHSLFNALELIYLWNFLIDLLCFVKVWEIQGFFEENHHKELPFPIKFW